MLASLCFLLIASGFFGEGMKAENFSLKDQFGKVHKVEFPREKITVLAFADREGSSQLESWIRPIYERYSDRIDIYGVAELSAVPVIMRGVVRSFIRKGTEYPVMLDWDGKVSMAYGYEKGVANIYVINKEGVVIMKQKGKANKESLEQIFLKIDKLLR
ncbi:MAG: redoxin domain-containing protein [Pyrinomonadaceae bacterium]|nr:redoxin domain-containing protein [Pyrinomonadaceae bacterium]MCX7640681.1 redoxin domain-containing protein [Pyrinomonadaceae bacterium]MDW8305365.1 hypothetical protein [Acidobacteriota bacterium]